MTKMVLSKHKLKRISNTINGFHNFHVKFKFRKKRQSSGGSSLRSQRDDFGGAVTLVTMQQGSIETIGSEADLAITSMRNDQVNYILNLKFR